MPIAEIATVAEGVRTLINAAGLGVAAVRSWRPSYTLPDLQEIQVCVTPRTNTETTPGRNVRQDDYRIEIGTLNKVDPANNDEVDALALLTEQIRDLLRDSSVSMGASPAARHVATEILYDPDHLAETRQFVSMIAVTYRLIT